VVVHCVAIAHEVAAWFTRSSAERAITNGQSNPRAVERDELLVVDDGLPEVCKHFLLGTGNQLHQAFVNEGRFDSFRLEETLCPDAYQG